MGVSTAILHLYQRSTVLDHCVNQWVVTG